MKPPISDLFMDTAKHFSKNKDVLQKVADKLGLLFSNSTEFRGNVCFANSPEVRPDFREIFTAIDLQNCIYAILHSAESKLINPKSIEINLLCDLIPTDTIKFWKLVKEGSERNQIFLLENNITEQKNTQNHK